MTDDRRISELDDANDALEEIRERLGDAVPAVFLDYDGTLTAIVDDPADATLARDRREAIEQLASATPVAVVSGRDLEDVRGMVGIDDIAYAGSHGFDMLLPDGSRERYGEEFLDDLDAAEQELHTALDDLDGITIERKGFAIAVHTRKAGEDERSLARDAVARADAAHPRLKVTGGKDIEELRPNMEWDKGRALQRLLEVLELDERYAPVYVGDDLTDEDGFAAISDRGIGIVVTGVEDRSTAAEYRLPDQEGVQRFLSLLSSYPGTGTG